MQKTEKKQCAWSGDQAPIAFNGRYPWSEDSDGYATCPGCKRRLKVRQGIGGGTWRMLPTHKRETGQQGVCAT